MTGIMMALAASVPQTVAIPAPTLYLDADNASSYSGSGTTVTDLSGNGYTNTLTGATYTVLNGVKCFDCTTGTNRVVVNGTGPTLPTTGYTYITWARLEAGNPAAFRTLLYTNSPKYTPITIPNGTNTLGYWDSAFRSSGYDLASSVGVWVQYAVVGDNSSQTFYINGSPVGNSIAYGAGGTTHWGWGNNDTAGQPWGYVANMFFYNTKLTQEQIQQNYYDIRNRMYNVISFTTTGTTSWTAPAGVTSVEYLVVGGGGGAGNGYDNAGGGGGGAGMVLTGTLSVTPGQSYTVTVGSGGTGGADTRTNNAGTAGNDSVFGSITALGGGNGLGSRTGGTVGAAQIGDTTAPTGGSGSGGGLGGKGGGGAGGAGSANSGATGGAGGAGVSNSITGSAVTYGVGGAGGGAGAPTTDGANGTANRGNGGQGGKSASSDSAKGGDGGSGIVVIRYVS